MHDPLVGSSNLSPGTKWNQRLREQFPKTKIGEICDLGAQPGAQVTLTRFRGNLGSCPIAKFMGGPSPPVPFSRAPRGPGRVFPCRKPRGRVSLSNRTGSRFAVWLLVGEWARRLKCGEVATRTPLR